MKNVETRLLEDLHHHQAELEAQNAELEAQNGELLRLTRALAQSQTRYRVLFECGPLPTFMLLGSGEVLEINAAARNFVVMSGRGFVSLQQLVLPTFQPMVNRLLAGVEAQGRAEAELGVRTLFGARLVLATLVSVADSDPESDEVHYILTMQDLTSLRSAEAQRDRERVERLRAVGLLAGAIAHDFGNSLQAIRANLEIALQSDSRSSLELAMQSLDAAAGMCRQLMDYIGQKSERDASCDLVRATLTTVRLCDPQGKSLRFRPLLVPYSDATLRVAMGEAAVHQIVLNLLRNASDAGGGFQNVAVRVGRGLARGLVEQDVVGHVGLAPNTPCGVIVVSDHGCGMELSQLRRSTDPFFTTKANGHGLGLSTVFGLVRGCGGNLRMWSRPSRGTIVRVELPLADWTEPRIAPASSAHDSSSSDRPLHLLVVDDERPVRDALTRLLRLHGHEVVACGDGSQALTALFAPEAHFDAAIIDITMPGISGIQVARRVQERNPTFPIVLCSGFAANVALGTEQLPPGVPLLQKPVSAAELLNAIHRTSTK